MSNYAIALAVGFNDETVAILAEIREDKLYIIKEKRSNGKGDNKITEDQMKQIYEFYFHYKTDKILGKYYVSYIPKILGWEEYNATVTVD